MEKAYKYRVYPTKSQQILIQKTFGCCRFVFNHFMTIQNELLDNTKHRMSFYDCSKQLTLLKQQYEWLQEPDKAALQNCLKDLNSAYVYFFELHYGFPQYKSKKQHHNSYRTNNGNYDREHPIIEFNNKSIKLPKIGNLKIRDKQIPQGKILNAVISQEPNGHYYCSLCCTGVEIPRFEKTNQKVGIDVGIVNFATLSNGIKIENPRFYKKTELKLAKLHQELDRKKSGSSNKNKSRIKLAKAYKHITNQRNDFLNKLTTELVKKYDVICIEDLDIEELLQKKLNTNIQSKTRHKNISDVSWYEFKERLRYKCEWYGKQLVLVDKYYPSSQICHMCGHNSGKKDISVRTWECCNCHSILDRDINAAINILNYTA